MAKRKVFSIGSSLSNGLEQTIAAAQAYSSDLRIDVIPLTKIATDPENPRALALTLKDVLQGIAGDDPEYLQKQGEIESLQSLVNSIQEQGIINPVLVYEHHGSYQLVAGERRTLASGLANKSDIQAKILDGKPNELKVRVLQWIENIERSDLSLAEKMDNLEKIVEAFARMNNISLREVTVTDISKIVGCVKSHAMNLKAVIDADEDIKQKIVSNQIRSLEKAAIISNIKSQNLRQSAINNCINGATLKQLKAMLEQDKNKPKKNIPLNTSKTSTVVNLGSTINLKVARIVLDSVVTQIKLTELSSEFGDLDFEDPKNISQAFRIIIKKLEQLHE